MLHTVFNFNTCHTLHHSSVIQFEVSCGDRQVFPDEDFFFKYIYVYNDRRRLDILSPVNRDPVERDHTTSTVHTHTPLDIILHCESWRLGKLTEAHHHQNKKQTSIGESIKRGQIDQKGRQQP